MTKQPSQQNITQRTIKSSFWLFGRRIFVNLLRLVTLGILARTLSPEEFGLVALAQVLLQLIILGQGANGPASYVIYDRQADWQERTHTVFWFNFVITVVLTVVLNLSTSIVTEIYQQHELKDILSVLIVVFFLKQIIVIPEAILKRSLNYRFLVIRDIFIDTLLASLSIVLALLGWGIWSLIFPQLAGELIRLIVTFYTTRWIPLLRFNLHDWQSIWSYSAPIMGSQTLILLINDGDTLLIGKILGSISLGYYNMAWQLANIVGRNVTSVVTNVAMPAMAMVKDNQTRLQLAYQRILRLLGATVFPLLFGMFVLADDLILLVYGPRWEQTVILLRILIIFTSIRAVTSPVGIIYPLVGRPDIGFKYSLCFLPVYLGTIIFFSQWGVVGIAVGVTLVRFVGAILIFEITNRLIGLTFSRTIVTIIPALFLSILMGGFVWGMNTFILWSMPLFIRTVVCIILGGGFYGIASMLFDPQAYNEVTKIIFSFNPYIGTKMHNLGRYRSVVLKNFSWM